MLKTATKTLQTTQKFEMDAPNVVQTLKAAPSSHPELNRLRAKLIAQGETEVAITRYDRMHHRHNRS